MELTAFENDVIAVLLANECPQAVNEVALLNVRSREHTGVGAYVHFDYLAEVITQSPRPSHIGSSIAIKIEGMKGSAGCVLFFEKGKIELLEFFTYGAAWPQEVTEYSFRTIR